MQTGYIQGVMPGYIRFFSLCGFFGNGGTWGTEVPDPFYVNLVGTEVPDPFYVNLGQEGH